MVPFQRTAVAPAAPASGRVVVQPGQALRRLARRAYGTGVRCTAIYLANRGQIRDARLIYPGQAFAVPAPGVAALPAPGLVAMSRAMTPIESFRSVLAPPHPVGRPFILGGVAVLLIGFFVGAWLAWLGALFTLFCLYFFRDPDRVPPLRPGAVVAPADGRVVSVAQAVPPAELGLGDGPRWRVAIFLSVLDVHVNRMPASGTVTRIAYRAGKFVNASMDKASEHNERNALALRLPDGRQMAVVQIAGLIARRIVCQVREGEAVLGGSRFGIIRFGSRTDLYLPEGVRPLVEEGQLTIGGETVLAELAAP